MKGILSFLILFSFSHNYFTQEVKEKSLDVAIGIDEIITLDYKYNTKIQIGDRSKVALILAPAKQEITIRGLKAGKTSLTVRDRVGDVRDRYILNITSDGNSNTVRELRDLLDGIEGIEIVILGGKVVIEGELVVPADIGRINTVLKGYPNVLPLFEISAQTQRIIARKMQEEIQRAGMKQVTVRVVNGDYWIEGVVDVKDKVTLAQNIVEAYRPDPVESLAERAGARVKVRGEVQNFVIVNETAVAAAQTGPDGEPTGDTPEEQKEKAKKMIKVTAQFVELTKDYQRAFSFSWNPLMTQSGSLSFGPTGDGSVSTTEKGTLAGTITNLFPKLNSARSAGYARVIQSGMAITEEGKAISINKSTAVPFVQGSGVGQTVSSTSFSFQFGVTPKIGAEEMIKLEGVNISVSVPGGTTSNNAPVTISNSISTNLSVKNKESAAIGGVVQTNSSNSYDKDTPQGGEGQPLFQLVRSKLYNTAKAQFVVFVTPEVIQDASGGTDDIRRKFRKRAR